ncbi:MAG: hypothetical protein DRP14_04875 [Candidatus Aenigmatarchaeota archaeon]|nr:MAG: hypothetical protein DRO41_00450 [Candidatus Bathyarchaeota archaeon]RLJ03587.1 MAG: hypothetical protein DRP14_04875 [Candidatus Aenigmarchaeota archaeon]
MSRILKIAFTGDRGVGKTTLAKDVAKALGISTVVVDVGEVDGLSEDLKTCYCMANYISLWLSGSSFVCDRWFSDNLMYAPAPLVRALKYLLRESQRDVYQFYVPPFRGEETAYGKAVRKLVRYVVGGVTREERVRSVLAKLKWLEVRRSGIMVERFLDSIGCITEESKRRFLARLAEKYRTQIKIAAKLGFDVKPVRALLFKYGIKLPGSNFSHSWLGKAYLKLGKDEVKRQVLECLCTSSSAKEATQKLAQKFNISESTAKRLLRHFKVIPGFGYQVLPPEDLGVRLE